MDGLHPYCRIEYRFYNKTKFFIFAENKNHKAFQDISLVFTHLLHKALILNVHDIYYISDSNIVKRDHVTGSMGWIARCSKV